MHFYIPIFNRIHTKKKRVFNNNKKDEVKYYAKSADMLKAANKAEHDSSVERRFDSKQKAKQYLSINNGYLRRFKNLDKMARDRREEGSDSKFNYKLKNRAIDLDSRTGIKPGKSTEEKKDMIKNNLEIAGVKNMDALRRRANENSEYLKNTPVRNRKNSIDDRMAKPEKSMAKKKCMSTIKDEIRQSTKRGLQQTKNAFTPHKKLTYKGF